MRTSWNPFGYRRLLMIGLIFGTLGGSQGCARRMARSLTEDVRPAYRSRFATEGSNLRTAPRGVTIPASGLGVDLVKRMHGKAEKWADDAVGQVAAPGFANIR